MAKNPPAEIIEESWFVRAADKIVREKKPFRLILDELEVGATSAEVEDIYRSKTFQAVLRAARHKYANEIASDPDLTKNTAIGLMMMCLQNLMDEQQWDKALDGLQKLAKLTGWQGADSNVNIFSDLKATDIDALRLEFETTSRKRAASKTAN